MKILPVAALLLLAIFSLASANALNRQRRNPTPFGGNHTLISNYETPLSRQRRSICEAQKELDQVLEPTKELTANGLKRYTIKADLAIQLKHSITEKIVHDKFVNTLKKLIRERRASALTKSQKSYFCDTFELKMKDVKFVEASVTLNGPPGLRHSPPSLQGGPPALSSSGSTGMYSDVNGDVHRITPNDPIGAPNSLPGGSAGYGGGRGGYINPGTPGGRPLGPNYAPGAQNRPPVSVQPRPPPISYRPPPISYRPLPIMNQPPIMYQPPIAFRPLPVPVAI